MSDIGSPPESNRAARAAAIMLEANERAKAAIDLGTAKAIATLLGEDATLAEDEQLRTPAATSLASAPWVPEWGNVKAAAKLLNLSRDRAVAAIRRHGLGHIPDGRWLVDLNRVRAYLAQRPYPPLRSVPSE